MKDFWSRYDSPYRFFSQFCDSDDWHMILKSVAGAVMQAARPNVQMSILDVGCGVGVATETICELIFTKTTALPLVTGIEPSQKARDRAEANLLRQAEGGVLRAIYGSLAEMPAEAKFDAITFLHSTYYINNFAGLLRMVVQKHLYPGGKVVVLVLPEDSVFFLQLPPLPNCTETIEDDFREIGLHNIAVRQLRSRFRLPPNCNLTRAEWESLCSFFRPEGMDVEEFKRRVEREFAADKVLNFQDCLVTGRRP